MQGLGSSVFLQWPYILRLLQGLWVTVRIALVSVGFSAILGVLFGLALAGRSRVVKAVGLFYLEAMRIVPVLVWLFVFYFGVPKLLSIHLDSEVVAILVFTLWGTAEMGDIVRGAVTSLPKHQFESGQALGLTPAQLQQYVIVPQAVRRMLPAAINLATRMVKTTSLVVLINVVELLKVGQQIIEASILSNPSAPLTVYGTIFVLYFIICWPLSVFSKKLEAKWQS
ncbi:MAG: amino acid ABC transporter permease [Oscillospiraceae bacterium]